MGRCNPVQRDHTGVGFLHAVGLRLALTVGLRLDCELRWIDQAVAPEAAITGPDVAYGTHGIFEVTGFTGPYFHPPSVS